MIRCLLPLLLLCNMVSVYAQPIGYSQQQNFLKANSVWAINGALIDFNSNPPVVTKNASIKVFEGSASVGDPSTGALLFYSNGSICWDRNGDKMPNGDSLFGNGGYVASGGSTVQGVCIVPMIDSPGKYYHFSLYGATDVKKPYRGGSLFYSVVDMRLRGGLGDVESGRKNIILSKDTLAEGMIAVPGDNCDLWLIVHHAKRPVFIAYHITAAGIAASPVVSKTGDRIQFYDVIGGMTLSPDRKKIAIYSFPPFCESGYIDSASGVLIAKFDATTGVVSDALEVEMDIQTYSVAFSPDNTKLYMAAFDHLLSEQRLQQYTISNHDTTSINASKQVVAKLDKGIIYMKLFRDTIYFLNIDSSGKNEMISSINKPNLSGTSCDYQNVAILFPKGVTGCQTLPTDVVYPLLPDTVHQLVFDTLVCSLEEGLELRPSKILNDYQYHWSNDGSDSTATIHNEGKYWVAYDNRCHYRVDTFIIRNSNLDQPVITVDVFRLSTTRPYKTYQWLFNGSIVSGANDSFLNVPQNGLYQVIVSNGQCTDTSEVYNVTNYTHILEPKEIADLIAVFPNPVRHTLYVNAPIPVDIAIYSMDGRLVKEIELAQEVSLTDLSQGIYFIRINSQDGSMIKVEKLIKLNTL